MAEKVNAIIICGSLRKGSFNASVARALPGLAPPGLALTPAPSIAGFPLFNADVEAAGFPADVMALADAIRAADGVVIVSPEYNWSIPGVLKNAIDWVSRVKDQPFFGKPVVLQSAARGLLGGARMQYHLRQSLTSVDAQIFIRPEVFVTFAAQKIDNKTGELKDQTTIDMIEAQLEGFENFVRARTGKS